MKFNFLAYFFVVFCLFGFIACTDEFSTNPGDKLQFSTGLLSFDTVFTTIGSRTEVIKVYNPNKKALNISLVELVKSDSSYFKINVDGATNKAYRFRDVEISAKDSMFIFVTVNIDPNDANTPVIVEDQLRFLVNGNTQTVRLEAYGQNVEILRNRFIYSDSTLTAVKPYVIYDTLYIAPAKTLTIEAGAKLYFHKNAALFVLGNLQAIGTLDAPIEMRGDRLDLAKFDELNNKEDAEKGYILYPIPYNHIAGQWLGVFLLGNEGNHHLNHVRINSSDVGLYFYNEDKLNLPDLKIENSRLHNFTLYGLVVNNGNVQVLNTEISNSGGHTVYLSGGKHTFIHSTLANYFNNTNGFSYQASGRDGDATVIIYDLTHEARMEPVFKNCVISGSVANEFSLLTNFTEQFNADISHSYIRRTDTISFPQFTNIRWYHDKDTVFKQSKYDLKENLYFDFALDSVSPARGIADPAVTSAYGLRYDMKGNDRTVDGAPDAGAYEWKSGF